ncbi:MAG: ribose-phosphate diphosphokinase [Planctomycetota bacterium]
MAARERNNTDEHQLTADERDRFRIFTGRANSALAEKIAKELGTKLGDLYINDFPDGEIDIKVNEDVRGRDIYIVQPTCPPVNQSIVELLLMIDCLRRASADRITAVIPYFGYARKDRKDEGRVPISAKVMANIITEAGADRVLSVDLHAAQIQGFFDIPVDHLYAKPVLISHFRKLILDNPVVVSPDVGGVKMARAYSKDLNADLAIVDKRRVNAKETVVEAVIGDVSGKTVLIVDDMISTGGSIAEACRIVKKFGAKKVYVGATHAVLCGPAHERLANSGAEQIFLTDTIPCPNPPANVKIVSIAPLLGQAILRIYRSQSVSDLFNEGKNGKK